MSHPVAVRRHEGIDPDPSRVVANLFVPGQELVGGHEARASGVVQRILELDEDTVQRTLDELLERFGHRHRDLRTVFSLHADRIGNRLGTEADLSEARWLLLGATFTHEYAVEAAAASESEPEVHEDYVSAYDLGRFAESARFVRHYPEQNPALRDLLPTIATPTQIVAGRDDDLVPWSNNQYLHDLLPNSHSLHLQRAHT